MNINSDYQLGEVVYVIIRNPHAQDVANVQEAAIVQHPDDPTQLALFLYETYFPLTEEFAIYKTMEEAEQAYENVFGMDDYYG